MYRAASGSQAVTAQGNRDDVGRGDDVGGVWESISANEMLRRVAGLSKALGELGIRSGDRVSIFAPNCPEWHVADFAIQGLGAVVVPIYFHESMERLTYILKDSGARIVFTAGEDQARRIGECRRALPDVENVISAAPSGSLTADDPRSSDIPSGSSPGIPPDSLASEQFAEKLRTDASGVKTPDGSTGVMSELKLRPPNLHDLSASSENLRYENLIAKAGDAEIAEYRRRAAEVTPEQLATLIYTSGTTGEPKGVMLSQANLSSNAHDFSEEFGMSPSDVALSLLPLAHVYERTVDYGYIFRGVSVAYVQQMETVAQALLEVRPTTMAAVPRFYEKTYANIIDKGHRETGLKRKIFDAAIRVAAEAVPWRAYGKAVSASVRLRWQFADWIVYSKIRAGVGGKIRTLSSGGGPLAPELAEFFWSVGLAVYQGYGLTETSPVVTFNSPKANKVGTVGRPIPNVQVRIAEDGEILVKGSCVMQGYYKKPEQTREVLKPDGWFMTGDIGRMDDDGYLVITDRKKELLKTSGGKFVAPAPIENVLKTSPLITNAMVVGDGRKFVSALVVLNFAGIEAEARKAGKEFSTHAQMLGDSWVRELVAHEIDRLTASLAQYEKPKRFALLEQDFTYAGGEMTYTFKLKRRVIEELYRDTIGRLYADVEEPRPQRMG
jgi:long-chain acyl-CoA synthetase